MLDNMNFVNPYLYQFLRDSFHNNRTAQADKDAGYGTGDCKYNQIITKLRRSQQQHGSQNLAYIVEHSAGHTDTYHRQEVQLFQVYHDQHT